MRQSSTRTLKEFLQSLNGSEDISVDHCFRWKLGGSLIYQFIRKPVEVWEEYAWAQIIPHSVQLWTYFLLPKRHYRITVYRLWHCGAVNRAAEGQSHPAHGCAWPAPAPAVTGQQFFQVPPEGKL